MYRRSDTADALGKCPRISRISSFQDKFDASPHSAARPGFGHHTTLYFYFDAKVAFNSGYRVNSNFWHSKTPQQVFGLCSFWGPPAVPDKMMQVSNELKLFGNFWFGVREHWQEPDSQIKHDQPQAGQANGDSQFLPAWEVKIAFKENEGGV